MPETEEELDMNKDYDDGLGELAVDLNEGCD
jgi:hypothetical protein